VYAEGHAIDTRKVLPGVRISTVIIPICAIEDIRGRSHEEKDLLFFPHTGGFAKKIRGRSHSIDPLLDLPSVLSRNHTRKVTFRTNSRLVLLCCTRKVTSGCSHSDLSIVWSIEN